MLSTPEGRDETLYRIKEHLVEQLGLRVCDTVAAFRSPAGGGAQVIVEPRPLVLGHLELEPDLFLYDPGIGAVGLAWMPEKAPGDELAASKDSPGSVDPIDAFVERCVDDAVALRHLCMQRARVAPTGQGGRGMSFQVLPLAVEAILMVPAADLARVGAKLRAIVASSGYLYTVGVNVLVIEGPLDGPTMAKNVRRAFRWLLHETRQRFAERRPGGVSSDGEGHRTQVRWSAASRLRLENYRLPGTRQLELRSFSPGSVPPIHLIFGRNGTGKSSLVEALELAMTGRIEFIEQANQGLGYAAILRNGNAAPEAKFGVALETPGASLNVAIEAGATRTAPTGEAPPALTAAACRLDQKLMDRLITTDRKAERAAIFLRLLFPDGRQLLASYEAAQRETLASGTLPAPEDIDSALAVLQRFASWSPSQSKAIERRGRAQLANEWLRAMAIAEMARQDERLTRVLEESQGDWTHTQPPAIRGWLEAARPPIPERGALVHVEHTIARLRALLGPSASPAPPGTAVAAPTLSPREVEQLDALDPWIAGASSRRLGQALAAALEHEQSEAFADVAIGTGSWAQDIVGRLQILRAAVAEIQSNQSGTVVIPDEQAHHFERLARARAAAEQARALERDVDQELAARIAALGEPLNELVNLLTPARWAYGDIVTQLEALNAEPAATSGQRRAVAGVGIAVASPGSGAAAASPLELRLNTAELNTVALAIFLLCAPRTDENVFKLFVLDDPLQNMDELTVSCVARGLARLQRAWPPEWRALMTVHGEDNFKCLAQEVFGAGYELPWLSPDGASSESPVKSRPLAIGENAAPQTLDMLMSPS